MTKKHYLAISDEIRAALLIADNYEARHAIECLTDRLATIFANDDPLFQKEKFLRACGVE